MASIIENVRIVSMVDHTHSVMARIAIVDRMDWQGDRELVLYGTKHNKQTDIDRNRKEDSDSLNLDAKSKQAQ